MTVIVLTLAGVALAQVIAPVWAEAHNRHVPISVHGNSARMGQGMSFGLLGGFRTLGADMSWLRMYAAWEKRDLPATEAFIRLTTAIDPRRAYFWLNGARILAHDVTMWRIQRAGGYDAVSPTEQDRISREQAQRALTLLAAGLEHHPANADLWAERASIELHRAGDLAAAAESYRRAWEQPRGPHYAARLHAELLRRLGRKSEALAWLVQLHPSLDPADEAAGADLVLGRIQELERELGVAPGRAYAAGR